MRISLSHDPFVQPLERALPWERGLWPCRWVACAQAGETPFVCAYRLKIIQAQPETVRVHVSADERYELWLNGERIGRGPERGHPAAWNFETYDLGLKSGENVLVARVWSLGGLAPTAQMSVHAGFLLAPDDLERLGEFATGVAAWQTKPLPGFKFPPGGFLVGPDLEVDGHAFAWGFERGQGQGWEPVRSLDWACAAGFRTDATGARLPVHFLSPSPLPPMLDEPRAPGRLRFVGEWDASEQTPVRAGEHLQNEAPAWTAFLQGASSLEVPAHTRRRAILDLDDYLCAYPTLEISGGRGSAVRVSWAESLFQTPDFVVKGQRDAVEGRYFSGLTDTFLPDGGAHRRFDTLWWKCGRFVQLSVETGDEPLQLERFTLHETRYPLSMESALQSDDEEFNALLPLAVRSVQMCAHETWMDCPFWEQLMYAGDTRLESLIAFSMTRDARLPRKALECFAASRATSGVWANLTQSRFPNRETQFIPPFALAWVGMLFDYALWRGERDFVRGLMPAARGILDCFAAQLNAQGLVESPRGWNFFDWVPAWRAGVPPGGEPDEAGRAGVSALLNWNFAGALQLASRLEAWADEPEQAARWSRLARDLASAAQSAFWNQERGLFADDLSHTNYSEHTQCLAILSGLLEGALETRLGAALIGANDPHMARTTIYFSHYLFETFARLGRMDALWERLGLWFDLPRQGFKTTFEMPEPSRSDCHGWGAHPLYHAFASFAGVRPGAFGFETVAVRPQLGQLRELRGRLVHPRGDIEWEWTRENDALRGFIALPPGVAGTLVLPDRTITLAQGERFVLAGA